MTSIRSFSKHNNPARSIDILRQIVYNLSVGQLNIVSNGGEFQARLSNVGLSTEGANQSDCKPTSESLRSMDPKRFHLWKVGFHEISNADGASLEDSSGRISQAIKQRMRAEISRILFVLGYYSRMMNGGNGADGCSEFSSQEIVRQR